jgi:hypothetical protein
MQSVRIRVDRVIDFGTIVSLIGTDLETERAVAVHVDLRPFAQVGQALPSATGLQQPITYDAAGCTLTLDLAPSEAEEASHA